MGHRLPFHSGGCANVHGHSYRMWVEIDGTCDESGMLIDFDELDRIVRPVITDLDHAFLCEQSDAVMREFLERNGFKLVLFDAPSTAENICLFLLRSIWVSLIENPRILALRLRLFETENSYAEASEKRS